MKALIFNSGIGKRMGELTQHTHKSLVKLSNGETLLERQIRILSECGIREFIITTGPYEEQLKAVASNFPQLIFYFVHNDKYDSTNYIYSFYLTRKYLDDDFLMMHGDLVFNKRLVRAVLDSREPSIGLINKNIQKPEKDFKARVINDRIKEVGINIFDDNCFAFQPFYKLSKENILAWWQRVSEFVSLGNCGVYAENALNEITDAVQIKAMTYNGYFINEIDDPNDYERVASQIRLFDFDEQEQIDSLAFLKTLKDPLLVVTPFLKNRFSSYKTFCDFCPNPTYEDVMKGLKEFEGCDCIVSIGGGSTIDVAKAIKYYSCLNEKKEFVYKNIFHYAVPTTAGTGSESTRYAVIYKDGIKQSLTHDAIFPNAAVLLPEFIYTLPDYQKKCTLLDALCHAIESIWSVNCTKKSITYAREAIEIIIENYIAYLGGDRGTVPAIQKAANLAGKAINISATTAAHAMSYKITSLFGIPHGYAVALTIPYLWEILIKREYPSLKEENITLNQFKEIFKNMHLESKITISNDQLKALVASVNTERLKNFPIRLSEDEIGEIYKQIAK